MNRINDFCVVIARSCDYQSDRTSALTLDEGLTHPSFLVAISSFLSLQTFSVTTGNSLADYLHIEPAIYRLS